MTTDEIVVRLDLGTLERLEDLPARLREHRQGNLEALAGRNPGLPLAVFQRLLETRRAEIALIEEALVNLGEPFEDDPC